MAYSYAVTGAYYIVQNGVLTLPPPKCSPRRYMCLIRRSLPYLYARANVSLARASGLLLLTRVMVTLVVPVL